MIAGIVVEGVVENKQAEETDLARICLLSDGILLESMHNRRGRIGAPQTFEVNATLGNNEKGGLTPYLLPQSS